jgi:hypothetical protein
MFGSTAIDEVEEGGCNPLESVGINECSGRRADMHHRDIEQRGTAHEVVGLASQIFFAKAANRKMKY